MNLPCVCCGNSSLEGHYADLLFCKKCSHVCANISLSDTEMHSLYSNKYFQGDEYGDYLADKLVLQRNFRLRLMNMQKHLHNMKHLSLFEVGCAYGFFLEIAKLYFASTRGIDLCESIIDHAQAQLGVQASSGNFIEIQPESNQVDVVCMWDTIEHLRSPEQFTAHAAKLLAPGGHLFLTTGDISSINAQLRKANWRLIHPPSHMHYFTRNSIRVLLESQGFEIREICYVGFYRSLSNTVANLCRGSKLTSLINYTSRSRLCYYLNLFDIMFIAARKR